MQDVAEEAAQALHEQEEALAIVDKARASLLREYLSRRGKAPAGTLRTALDVLCRLDAASRVLTGTQMRRGLTKPLYR